ncbi:uncharacterized protein LOC144311578 [Canis aureus]
METGEDTGMRNKGKLWREEGFVEIKSPKVTMDLEIYEREQILNHECLLIIPLQLWFRTGEMTAMKARAWMRGFQFGTVNQRYNGALLKKRFLEDRKYLEAYLWIVMWKSHRVM